MDQFEDLKSLGRGAFANVRLVRRLADDELVVVKKFHVALNDLSAKERSDIAQEIKVLAHLRHPNIIEFKENFVEGNFTHIVMEYATGGTLYKKIVNRDGELFPESQIWEMFVQVVMAMRYVHSKSILHRDLKAENIMLSGINDRVIKLGDFGIAKILGSQADMAATIIGTPHSLSPELVQGAGYDYKSDVWALGCVLYEIAALRKPFDASNMPAIIFSIMRNNPAPIPDTYSPELKAMVKLLLRANPADRPSLPDLEAMPIIQEHIAAWRNAYRALEVERGLPMSSVTAALAALPSARPSVAGMSAALSTTSATIVTSRIGSTTMRSPTSDASPASMTSPTHHRAKAAQSAQFERDIIAGIEDVSRDLETGGVGASVAIQARLDDLHKKMETGPPNISGRAWEMLGRAWAECGPPGFNRAIMAYRRSISAKSGSASLVAMEQLGNLLVRRAQQIWAKARAGKAEEALEEAQMLLENSSKTILSKITGKQARGGKVGYKGKRASAAAADAAADASADGAPADVTGTTGGDEEDPAWRQAAAALMYEGLAYIERMCSLGATAERRSLLGSAYKRRAWTGLGQSRKDDLQQAALNYAAAQEIDLETDDGHTTPSPYARLNQLTLELLAGNGTEEERTRLLEGSKEAEQWGNVRKEENPTDVWLWVQVVDARCLRYLLSDEEVSRDDVVNGYREQFAFGTTARVKSSVMDQFSFLEEVLQGRVEEVEAEAHEKAAHAAAAAAIAARTHAATPTPTGVTAPDAVPREDGTPAAAAAVPRRLSAPESEDSAPLMAAAALMGAKAESASQTGSGARGLRRISQLESIPETAPLLQVRAWLMAVLDKVRDLRKRLEKHVTDADAAAATAATAKPIDNSEMIAKANEIASAAVSVKTADPAVLEKAESAPPLLSPRASTAFGRGTPAPGEHGTQSSVTSAVTSVSNGTTTKSSTTGASSTVSTAAAPVPAASPTGASASGENPFARKAGNKFELQRRKLVVGAAIAAAPQEAPAPVEPANGVASAQSTAAAARSPASVAPLSRQPSASKLGGPNPFARSTPSQAKFQQTKKHVSSPDLVSPTAARVVARSASSNAATGATQAAPPSGPTTQDEDTVTVVHSSADEPAARGGTEALRSGSRTRLLPPIEGPYLPSAIMSPTPLDGRQNDPFSSASPTNGSSSSAGVAAVAMSFGSGAPRHPVGAAGAAYTGSNDKQDRLRTVSGRRGSATMTFDSPVRDADADSAAAGLVLRAEDLAKNMNGGNLSNTMKSTTSSTGRDTRRFNAPPALILTPETSHVIGATAAVAQAAEPASSSQASVAPHATVTSQEARASSSNGILGVLEHDSGYQPSASASAGDLSARAAGVDTPDRSALGAGKTAAGGFPAAGQAKRIADDIATPSGVKATVIPSTRGPWGSRNSIDIGSAVPGSQVFGQKQPSPAAGPDAVAHSGVLSTPNGGLAIGYPSRRGSASASSPAMHAQGASDVVSNMFTAEESPVTIPAPPPAAAAPAAAAVTTSAQTTMRTTVSPPATGVAAAPNTVPVVSNGRKLWCC